MTIFILVLVTLAGIAGATASVNSYNGGSLFWPFLTGQAATLSWALLTKRLNPWQAAITFNVFYDLTWLVALYFLGERPTPYALVGAVLVLAGLTLTHL
jgi:uncharacterized membrane protein